MSETMQGKAIRWWLVAVSVPLLLFVGALIFQLQRGIEVSIQNTGSTAMNSVVLHVTGASQELGNIPPGASATATINPKGESGLEIEFTDSDGKSRRLNAGGYFEPGYRGTIHVSIKDSTIERNEQDINPW